MSASRLSLEQAISDASERGRRVPCRRAYRDWWTSTSKAERRAAVARCEGCAVLTLCGDYADAHGERLGVWAGVDRTPPRPPKRRAGKPGRKRTGTGGA